VPNANKKVADYSAQAVINTILSQAFPEDPIVGEEDASDLRAPTTTTETEARQVLRARVVELADDILAQPPTGPSPTSSPSSPPCSLPHMAADCDSGVDGGGGGGEGGGERAEWGLGRRWGADALLKAIDRGNYAGGRSGRASLPLSIRFRFSFFCSRFVTVYMLIRGWGFFVTL
jgi:3'(2'), 5'-bisphosphate nucleotidase